MPALAEELRITVDARVGDVSALLLKPEDARLLYVLAHGAGAGMRHPFLESLAARLGARGVATLRYQFPYVEQRARRPDPPEVAAATVRAAVEEAGRAAPALPLVAGGKSFGGRMTSTAAAAEPLPGGVVSPGATKIRSRFGRPHAALGSASVPGSRGATASFCRGAGARPRATAPEPESRSAYA